LKPKSLGIYENIEWCGLANRMIHYANFVCSYDKFLFKGDSLLDSVFYYAKTNIDFDVGNEYQEFTHKHRCLSTISEFCLNKTNMRDLFTIKDNLKFTQSLHQYGVLHFVVEIIMYGEMEKAFYHLTTIRNV
jgi:predicted nucleotidyltransferase